MSKVFTSKEFIKKLKWLVNDVPNYYVSQAGTWDTYNSSNGKWRMDCVCSIKGLLWGFKADKSKTHGGAIYGSNGVADFTDNGGIDYCKDASQNFKSLTPGEYLCMKGTRYGHAGVYLGNGKVFECTTGWGTRRCIISDIDKYGNRSYKGSQSLKWTWHGKLIYIDYSDQKDDDDEGKDDDEMTTYKNGSTVEPVYADTALKNKIGSLDPHEKCDCYGEFKGRAVVRYKVNGTSDYKIGFCKWLGGIQ